MRMAPALRSYCCLLALLPVFGVFVIHGKVAFTFYVYTHGGNVVREKIRRRKKNKNDAVKVAEGDVWFFFADFASILIKRAGDSNEAKKALSLLEGWTNYSATDS